VSDKPLATFTTFLIITPLLAICCLLPVFGGAVFAAVIVWFTGFGAVEAVLAALIFALAVLGFIKWRRLRAKTPTNNAKG